MATSKRAKQSTLLPHSREDERRPEVRPEGVGETVDKLAAETGEGQTLTEKAKLAIEELDRELAGDYERREDPAGEPPRKGGQATPAGTSATTRADDSDSRSSRRNGHSATGAAQRGR